MKKFILLLIFVFLEYVQGQTNLKFSVQPGVTSAIASGTSNALTINAASGLATFAVALPDTIGPGDILIYDANNNGTNDNVAVFKTRTNQQTWTLSDSLGTLTYLNGVSGDTDWQIYRAYTSLNNALSSTENTGIPVALRSFNVWVGGTLITGNYTLTLVLYPGTDATAVTNATSITSNGSNYLTMYTPYLATEVGSNMRHNGVWTGRCYFLSTSATALFDASTGAGIAHHFTFEGMQFKNMTGDGIYNNANGGNQTFYVSNCIFIGSANSSTLARHSGIYLFNSFNSRFILRNNIYYDWQSTAVSNSNGAITFNGSTSDTIYAYNQTMFNGDRGISIMTGTSGVIAKNCVAKGQGTNWLGTFHSTSKNNTDNKSAAPGSNASNGVIPAFVDSTAKNFHLKPSDTVAKDTGANLSTDPRYTHTNDVDDGVRAGTWDRGADEDGVAKNENYTVSETPSISPVKWLQRLRRTW